MLGSAALLLSLAARPALAGTFQSCVDKSGQTHLYDSSKPMPPECAGASRPTPTPAKDGASSSGADDRSSKPGSASGPAGSHDSKAKESLTPFEVEVRTACQGDMKVAEAKFALASRKVGEATHSDDAARRDANQDSAQALEELHNAQAKCSAAVASAFASGVQTETLKSWGAP